jgi:8-oxo-dGTP pyrophosphatase MutT (NUDIX family)
MGLSDVSGDTRPIHRVAATVVLLRDGADGPEVLMLERPRDRGSFAGAWVFPGGSVDLEDGLVTAPEREAKPGEETAARHAAVREVREETALDVAEAELQLVACWSPPPTVPRRFRTWFYYAKAPAGTVALSPEESIDSRWIRPADALALHAAGSLSLVPPTWVTLHGLTLGDTVAAILERARARTLAEFVTRMAPVDGGNMFLWHGDVAYADDALMDAKGARHRLDTRVLPWSYDRSAD